MTANQTLTTQPRTTLRRFEIDPAHSSAEFAVKHLMIATVKGSMKILRGTVSYDPGDPARAT